jgi:hypothetical protein
MLVWGGFSSPGIFASYGGRYNPTADAWATLESTGAPSPRSGNTVVWTGSEMVLWGGAGPPGHGIFSDGGRYNPATNAWAPVSTANAPGRRFDHTAVWTGTEMLVWGGSGDISLLSDGGRYTPPPSGPPPRKKVVFLAGVCSSRPDGTQPYAYDFIQLQTLLRNNLGYRDDDFLLYSYNGGSVTAEGRWHHNAYGRDVPVRRDFTMRRAPEGSREVSPLQALHDQLLVEYRLRHPNTTFVLVGHSLGGVVAMEEVRQVVDSADYEPGLLSTVITLDSPLRGVTKDVGAAGYVGSYIDLVEPCVVRGVASGRLVWRHLTEPESELQGVADRAGAKGVAVVTIGNDRGCLFEPRYCGVPVAGDIQTQWIFDAAAKPYVFRIAEPPCWLPFGTDMPLCTLLRHGAVLNGVLAPDALRAAAENVGPQSGFTPAVAYRTPPVPTASAKPVPPLSSAATVPSNIPTLATPTPAVRRAAATPLAQTR